MPADIIRFPSRVMGWHFRSADQSAHPSRPMAGTLDPSQAVAFVWKKPGVSSFEIAYRLGWTPREAYEVCDLLFRDGILAYETTPIVLDGRDEATSCWRLTVGTKSRLDALEATQRGGMT